MVSQYLKTDENHGYMILDVERKECAALPWLHPLARWYVLATALPCYVRSRYIVHGVCASDPVLSSHASELARGFVRSPSTVFELKDKMSKLKHTIWCRSLLRSSVSPLIAIPSTSRSRSRSCVPSCVMRRVLTAMGVVFSVYWCAST